MANLLPQLAPDDQALALVHGLTFVARDTRNHAPRFAVGALETQAVPVDRLGSWYRRFVDTRSSDAAERTLETALAEPGRLAEVEAMMFAAVTDHVFIDGGHTIDFTNKAFEAVEHLGKDAAGEILPTLVRQTTAASRSEEFGEWRHPHDHAALARRTIDGLDAALAEGRDASGRAPTLSAALGWQLLDDDPEVVAAALLDALRAGADEEQIGRAVAYAAALRIVRFHVQNDHGDWDTVHHAFTAANGLHQALQRRPTPELLRGAVHTALRINLDRFLNVPAARLPHATAGSLDALAHCFDVQGMVDEAGNEAYGFLRGGGARAELVAALGHALLAEDAEFHWYQVLEAGVRQSQQWPEGSEEAALVLTAVARFFVGAHADPPRAPDRRAHRHPPPPRRSPLRRRRRRGSRRRRRVTSATSERSRVSVPCRYATSAGASSRHSARGTSLSGRITWMHTWSAPASRIACTRADDRVEVAPGDDRVDEPVAALLREVVVAVAEPAQVVRVVGQARRRPRCAGARSRAPTTGSRVEHDRELHRDHRVGAEDLPRAGHVLRRHEIRDARPRRDRAASPSIRGRSAASTRASTGNGTAAASSPSRYSTIFENGFV